jgi:uncharacterized protein YoxC
MLNEMDIIDTYKTMDKGARIQLYILIGIAIFVVISMVFVFQATKRINNPGGTVEILEKQNKELIKNNEALLHTVNDLNMVMHERNQRDSVTLTAIQNATNALPGINDKLSKLDKQQNEKIKAVRNYSADDSAAYIRSEAARIRNSQ